MSDIWKEVDQYFIPKTKAIKLGKQNEAKHLKAFCKLIGQNTESYTDRPIVLPIPAAISKDSIHKIANKLSKINWHVQIKGNDFLKEAFLLIKK